MRAIDQMTPEEIDTLKLKGMLPDKAAPEAPQVAQYGEGRTKFYADKRGSETLKTYKLTPEQRDEVLRLAEQAQNDLDAVLFKLVCERDEARKERDKWKDCSFSHHADTIEQLREQLRTERASADKSAKALAAAEQLAEALRELDMAHNHKTLCRAKEKARTALAQWEGNQ